MQNDVTARIREALTEADCLCEAMRLRFGSRTIVCPACGKLGRFEPIERQRALSCSACGHAVHPCRGTPMETLRTPLQDWFFAIALQVRSPQRVAKGLQRELGLAKATAERLDRDVAGFAELSRSGASFAGWLDAIAAFVEARVPGSIAASSGTLSPATAAGVRPAVTAATASSAPARAARRARWPYVAAAAVMAIGATSVAVSLAPWRDPDISLADDDDERRFAPELSAMAPRPSIELAAVEEEVASAKAAVEAVLQAEAAAPAPPPPTPQATPARPSSPDPAGRAGNRAPDPGFRSTGDPNEVLAFGNRKVRRHLVETIVRASRAVGADPTLLMAIADKESSFATEVKAQTSSATGLYQFIEKTWLGVIFEFGAKHGLEREARLVVRGSSGYTVGDPAEKLRILELRREPYLAALMAGEMLKKDTLRIEQRLKRHLSAGEIYLIHFLGPDAAQDLMNSVDSSPDVVAASKFTKAAEANKSIFYSNDRGKSVAEIRKDFDAMMGQRIDRFREVRRLTGPVPASLTR